MSRLSKGKILGCLFFFLVVEFVGWRGRVAAALRVPTEKIPMVNINVHGYPGGPFPGSKEARRYYWTGLRDQSKASGVTRMLIGTNANPRGEGFARYSPDHDEWSREAYRIDPLFYAPMVSGFNPADPAAPEYVRRCIREGIFVAVGEIDLRNETKRVNIPINHPVMMQVYRIAGEHGMPVLIHANVRYALSYHEAFEELRDALESNPRTTIILAHAVEGDLMARLPGLWCQTEPHTFRGEQSLQYPQRTLVGFETLENLSLRPPGTPWGMSIEEGVQLLRRQVMTLPRPAQEALLHGNAERIYRFRDLLAKI